MRHPVHFASAVLAALLVAGCATVPAINVPTRAEHQRQAVVFDIDGTLTPHNLFFFEARPGAAQAVQAYARKGYQIVYITTRIPLFQWSLTGWLHNNGFPPGVLHVAQNAAERDDAASFKAAVLARYRAAGWGLPYAYGDSASDFDAYARAGLPAARIFALKRRFADTCAGAHFGSCLDGWVGHLPFVERVVPLTP